VTPARLLDAPFIASLRLRDAVFDPERKRQAWLKHKDSEEMPPMESESARAGVFHS